MTELRNNLNMESEGDEYSENDSVTWLVQLDEQRIREELKFGGRTGEDQQSWGQFGIC